LYILNKIIEFRVQKGKVNRMHALMGVSTRELGQLIVFVVGPSESNLAITRGRRDSSGGGYWGRGGSGRVWPWVG
jgi:hypothetical protein